jgi:hypothetical protein
MARSSCRDDANAIEISIRPRGTNAELGDDVKQFDADDLEAAIVWTGARRPQASAADAGRSGIRIEPV